MAFGLVFVVFLNMFLKKKCFDLFFVDFFFYFSICCFPFGWGLLKRIPEYKLRGAEGISCGRLR